MTETLKERLRAAIETGNSPALHLAIADWLSGMSEERGQEELEMKKKTRDITSQQSTFPTPESQPKGRGKKGRGNGKG